MRRRESDTPALHAASLLCVRPCQSDAQRKGDHSQHGPHEEVPDAHQRHPPTKASHPCCRQLGGNAIASGSTMAASTPPSSQPTCRGTTPPRRATSARTSASTPSTSSSCRASASRPSPTWTRTSRNARRVGGKKQNRDAEEGSLGNSGRCGHALPFPVSLKSFSQCPDRRTARPSGETTGRWDVHRYGNAAYLSTFTASRSVNWLPGIADARPDQRRPMPWHWQGP
jgi:hypothetical protein